MYTPAWHVWVPVLQPSSRATGVCSQKSWGLAMIDELLSPSWHTLLNHLTITQVSLQLWADGMDPREWGCGGQQHWWMWMSNPLTRRLNWLPQVHPSVTYSSIHLSTQFLCMNVSIHLFIHILLQIFTLKCISVCLHCYIFNHPSIHALIYPFILSSISLCLKHTSACAYWCMPMHASIHPSIHLPICPCTDSFQSSFLNYISFLCSETLSFMCHDREAKLHLSAFSISLYFLSISTGALPLPSGSAHLPPASWILPPLLLFHHLHFP